MSPRADSNGRAYKGSQLQVQVYVNRRQAELDAAIAAACFAGRSPRIRWASPIEIDRFRECRGGQALDLLGLARYQRTLEQFWPRHGHVWDALAETSFSDANSPAYVLVEAKSYPREHYGRGCKATDLSSRRTIEKALAAAKNTLGADARVDWMGKLYQYANRLAFVNFLRANCGLDAKLVNLCFLDDPHRPTTLGQWRKAESDLFSDLGLSGRPAYVATVYLPARSRAELIGP